MMRRLLALSIVVALSAVGSRAHADTSVVGRSDRTKFGRWEWVPFPRMAASFGTSTHLFAIGSISSGSVARTPPEQTTQAPSDLLHGNTVVAQAIDLRPLIVHVAGPFYLGPMVSIGPAFRSGTPSDARYSVGNTGVFFEGGLVPGFDFQLGELPLTVRTEILLGGRLATFNGNTNDQKSFLATSMTWVAQPRVALDMWTSPFVTVGAFAGANVVRQNDYVVGLSLAAHFAPYDATP